MCRWILLMLVVCLLSACGQTSTELQSALFPEQDGGLVLLYKGRLFQLHPNNRVLLPLGENKVSAAYSSRGRLFAVKENGRIVILPGNALDKGTGFLVSGKVCSAGRMNNRIYVSTVGGLHVLKSGKRAWKIAAGGGRVLTGSAQAAYLRKGELFVLSGRRLQRIADNVLSAVINRGALYFSTPEGGLHVFQSGVSRIVPHFSAPDGAPFVLLGRSPDSRYIYGITDATQQSLFLSLDLKDGKIFMAPVRSPVITAAISYNNSMRYILTDSHLLIYGFQQGNRGLLRSIRLQQSVKK